jgi:phosphomannomutase
MSLDTIFKAYDVRGKVGSELNPEVAELIGKAFADWLSVPGPVMVGRDMRPDSKGLIDALINGLLSRGRDVIDIGEVTSDMIYFAVGSNSAAGGIMVTASHNPGVYNGIKFCADGAKPIGEDTGLLDIRDLAMANNFVENTNKGKISQLKIDEQWVSHVLSFIDVNKLKPLKIAVDAGNGMAGKIFPELEPYVPFDVTELFFDLDGTFPNHVANPLIIDNLKDLQATIKAGSCDAGVAFDGDGDRAVLIDENGEPLSGTVMAALLSEYFLDKYPGSTILCNAICGRAAKETIEAKGGKFVRTKVGHSFIKADMRKHNAVFAGEHSGHYYFKNNYMADSGLIAAVIGLYLMSLSGKKLSVMVAPFRKAYTQIQETNFEVEDKDKALKTIAKEFESEDIDWLDGLTVNFADAWFNVRPSNTEPLLRMNAEAKNKENLDKIVARVTALINAN